jgi:hypothetical protein
MSSSGRATSRLNHPAPQAAGPLEHGFRRVLPLLTETAIRGLALSPSRREAPARAVPATQPSVQQCSGTAVPAPAGGSGPAAAVTVASRCRAPWAAASQRPGSRLARWTA